MSWQAGLVHGLIRLAGKLGPSVDKQRAELERRGPTGGSVPKKLAGVDITTSQQHGMTVVRLSPTGSAPGRTVFYAHGGSYCFEAASL